MDFDVDAAVRQVTAQLEALRDAAQTPTEERDTSRLLPVFIPASLCSEGWCGPYYRLRNPDVGLTWCVLTEGGAISYVNHQQRAHWETKGLDWKGLALSNLVQRSRGQKGITVLNKPNGEVLAISFQFADGLGSSHLLRRGLLSKHFPNGYRVVLPDRGYGMAYSAELGPEDLSKMHQTIQRWYARGSHVLASGVYEPDELLPEKTADRERHLAHLGQNPRADVLRLVMDAYHRGDYEEALRRTEDLKLLGEVSAAYCFHRGANLGHLGSLDEAEEWLRRNIEMHQEDGRTRLRAIGLTTLGQVMLQAGRYREAEEYFKESIGLWPERASGYRYMAELRLLSGDDYADALRWAECAVSRERALSDSSAEVGRLNLGEHLATLAWATAAASHDVTEVVRLAGEAALPGVGENENEPMAQVQSLLGCAFTELRDQQTAKQHYIAESGRARSEWILGTCRQCRPGSFDFQ